MMASVCSQIPAVREKLVQLQRGMGERKSVIMDGRDIGTNVLKDAEYKIYLTASAVCLFAGAVINLKKSRDLNAHIASLQA